MRDAKLMARMLRQHGRGPDTMLAELSPGQHAMLTELGGGFTVNPSTGLPEHALADWAAHTLSLLSPEQRALFDQETGGDEGRMQDKLMFLNPQTYGQQPQPAAQQAPQPSSAWLPGGQGTRTNEDVAAWMGTMSFPAVSGPNGGYRSMQQVGYLDEYADFIRGGNGQGVTGGADQGYRTNQEVQDWYRSQGYTGGFDEGQEFRWALENNRIGDWANFILDPGSQSGAPSGPQTAPTSSSPQPAPQPQQGQWTPPIKWNPAPVKPTPLPPDPAMTWQTQQIRPGMARLQSTPQAFEGVPSSISQWLSYDAALGRMLPRFPGA